MSSRSLLEHAERGPHPVGLLEREIRDSEDAARRLPLDIWYPAEPGLRGRDLEPDPAPLHPFGQPHQALLGARPAAERFPLIAFSHGNSGLRRQSTFLTTHLASWGFVVAAPDHSGNTFAEMAGLDEQARVAAHLEARRNRPRDLAAGIEAALAGGSVAPAVDAERIGVLGHSYGGWTAFKMPALDRRVRAVCGLAPASEPFVGRKAFDPAELPLPRGVASLIVAGVDDVLVDLETSVRPLAARLAAPTRLVGLEQTDHFHFCDGVELLHGMHFANPRPNQTRPTKPGAALLPQERVHRIVRALVTGFFASALLDADDPVKNLDPEATAALGRCVHVLS